MEIIRKTINLDDFKSHRKINNISAITDNFIYDLKINKKIIKYLDLLRKYNFIQKQLRDAIFLSKKGNKYLVIDDIYVNSGDCNVIKEYDNFCKYDFTPHDINNFVYKDQYYSCIKECVDEKIVLLENYNKVDEIELYWKNLVGQRNINFQFCRDFELYIGYNDKCSGGTEISGLTYEIPTIDIPILLTNDTLQEELYYPYEYSVSANGEDIITAFIENAYTTYLKDYSDDKIYVESKLESLKSFKTVYMNDTMHGIFKEDGQMYKYFKGEWSKIENTTDFKCVDGEEVNGNIGKKYINIPLKSCISNFKIDSGKTYYFLVKYINDKETPLAIPYVKGEKLHQDTYEKTIYDTVTSIVKDVEKQEITIDYALGVTEGKEESGIYYREILPYEVRKEIVVFDNIYECEIYYEYIDYNKTKVLIYDNELRLERKINKAQIIKMEIISGSPFETLLITKDSANSLQEEPKYDINMIFNRGASSAWENHFKLSECNTMDDLEKYGNNYFNL